MRKTFLFGCVISICLLSGYSNAQATDSSVVVDSLKSGENTKTKIWDKEHPFEVNTKAVKIVPYGFVRNDFYYDSRENFETASGLFYVIPKDRDLNALGEDLNDVSSSRFLSIATRIGVKVYSNIPILKSQLMAQVETDFAGYSGSTTMLRIRQAFVKMDWEKWSFLAGQTWHPMFGTVVPEVQSLATGSPFQPFNRSPQIRIDAKTFGNKGTEFRVFASAIYQFQYASVGPDGSSPKYQTNAKVPEAYLGLELKNAGFLFGVGAEMTTLKPRDYELSADSTCTYITDRTFMSMAWNAYLQYITPNGKFRVRAKSIYGGNMSHLLLLSGYAEIDDKLSGARYYYDVKTWTSWLNLVYGTKWQVGVFGGYMKNFGVDHCLSLPDVSSEVYMFGYNNIAGAYRVSPMLCYNLKHFSFGVEYEMTATSYGKWEDSKELFYSTVENTHWVKNHRVVAVMMLHF